MNPKTLVQVGAAFLLSRPREHRPSAHRTTWRATVSTVLVGLAVAASPLTAEQSIPVLDWKDAAVDSAPDTNFSKGFIRWSNCRVVVVGPQTDPPSPILDEQALLVAAEENSTKKIRFQIEAKPFSPENAPAEGWFDFQLMVNKAFDLQLGVGGSSGADVRKENPYDGVTLVTFLIAAQGSGSSHAWTTVDGKVTERTLRLIMPPDTMCTLRVHWTTTPETIDISFQIDGVDALESNSLSIPNPGSATGIDYFSLKETRSDAVLFVGKISAGTP